MTVFAFDSIQSPQAYGRDNVALCPADGVRALKMTVELQMMLQKRLRSGCAQGHNGHQQLIGSVLAYHNDGSNLDDFRDLIASKITNQHAALLGLIKKCHPYHSLEKSDSAQHFCE